MIGKTKQHIEVIENLDEIGVIPSSAPSSDDNIPEIPHTLLMPITSVKSLSEILHDNADIDAAKRREFLEIIIKETDRLTDLIRLVFNLSKLSDSAAKI